MLPSHFIGTDNQPKQRHCAQIVLNMHHIEYTQHSSARYVPQKSGFLGACFVKYDPPILLLGDVPHVRFVQGIPVTGSVHLEEL